MSEQGMRSVEERLRAAGRADAPPDSYGQLARAAALGAEPKPREARGAKADGAKPPGWK